MITIGMITIGQKPFRAVLTVLLLAMAAMAFSACERPVQETVRERQAALGEAPDKTNYLEARQIQEVEAWKDQPGKIVTLYINFPPNSGNVMVFSCRGVPNSSTESLEPNVGYPNQISFDTFLVPVDGVDIRTNELAGRDGTWGEPVAFRYCMTVDGQYIDFPAYGVPYIVSSGVYTFPPSAVQRDVATEVRLLQAERIIERGGCVHPETLAEIPCPEGSTFHGLGTLPELSGATTDPGAPMLVNEPTSSATP